MAEKESEGVDLEQIAEEVLMRVQMSALGDSVSSEVSIEIKKAVAAVLLGYRVTEK